MSSFKQQINNNNNNLDIILDTIRNLNGGGNSAGIQMIQETVTSDAQGIIHFPTLNFTPQAICIWDIFEETNSDETDNTIITQHGIFLSAFQINGQWISQALMNSSGEVAVLTNAAIDNMPDYDNDTLTSKTAVFIQNGTYCYQLYRALSFDLLDPFVQEYVANRSFNYIIYGV